MVDAIDHCLRDDNCCVKNSRFIRNFDRELLQLSRAEALIAWTKIIQDSCCIYFLPWAKLKLPCLIHRARDNLDPISERKWNTSTKGCCCCRMIALTLQSVGSQAKRLTHSGRFSSPLNHELKAERGSCCAKLPRMD